MCAVERVLEITLLEYIFVTNCYCCYKTERTIFKERSIALGLMVKSVFEVSQDDNARLGREGFPIFIIIND